METNGACIVGVNQIELRRRDIQLGKDDILVKTHLAGYAEQTRIYMEASFRNLKAWPRDAERFVLSFFIGHEGGGTWWK